MGKWQGVLNRNEILGNIYNMIISIQTFSRITVGNRLVDKARVDGSLYGDKKLYIGVDTLTVHDWGVDSNGVRNKAGLQNEASNLLELEYAPDPKVQEIVLNVFKQIRLSVDDILSKRGFNGEYSFGEFISIVIGMLSKTKEIYDYTTYNSFFGTRETEKGNQEQTIQIPNDATPETEVKLVAQGIADLLVDMNEVSRDYNDNEQTTIFSKDEIHFVVNSKYYNKFRKVDLPAIFHQDGLMDKLNEDVLSSRYFGTINEEATEGDGSTVRALECLELTVSGEKVFIFAGQLIPDGVTAPAGKSYTEDPNIIAKAYVKLPPYMSNLDLSTSFYNPRSHTTTRYTTIGRNTLEHLEAYPFVTIRKASA